MSSHRGGEVFCTSQRPSSDGPSIEPAHQGSVVVVLLVAVLAIAGALAKPQPAQAHDDGGAFHMEHHCLGGDVCMFEANNYDHAFYRTPGDLANYWPQIYDPATDDGHQFHRLNDTVDSVDNDGGQCGSSHYNDAGYNGASFWLPKGNAINNLGPGFENKMSSHRWCVL